MSAATENLLLEITKAEERFTRATQAGDILGAQRATEDLKNLRRSLVQANEALTEGRQILKG